MLDDIVQDGPVGNQFLMIRAATGGPVSSFSDKQLIFINEPAHSV